MPVEWRLIVKVEFDINVKADDIMNYKFYHKYHSLSGWCEIILGLMMLGLGVYSVMHQDTMSLTFALLALLFGIVFIVVIPLQLVTHSKKAAASEQFAKPMHYLLDESGITVKMGEDEANVEWKRVYRVKDTGRCILIYFTPTRANIIPKNEVTDKLADIRKVMTDGIGRYKVSIK